MSISTITWTNSRSGSTGGRPVVVANFSIDWFSKLSRWDRCRTKRLSLDVVRNHNI